MPYCKRIDLKFLNKKSREWIPYANSTRLNCQSIGATTPTMCLPPLPHHHHCRGDPFAAIPNSPKSDYVIS